jgi:hypothetical protein
MAEPVDRTAASQVPVIVQPPARGVIALGGDLLDALKTSPVVLLIVILNIAFAGAGAYYLLQVEAYRAGDRQALAKLLTECLTHTVPIEYLKLRPPP